MRGNHRLLTQQLACGNSAPWLRSTAGALLPRLPDWAKVRGQPIPRGSGLCVYNQGLETGHTISAGRFSVPPPLKLTGRARVESREGVGAMADRLSPWRSSARQGGAQGVIGKA